MFAALQNTRAIYFQKEVHSNNTRHTKIFVALIFKSQKKYIYIYLYIFFGVGFRGCWQNGQSHETWEGSAYLGENPLRQHGHCKEHWWWHLRSPLLTCSGSQNWSLYPSKLTNGWRKKSTKRSKSNYKFVITITLCPQGTQ